MSDTNLQVKTVGETLKPFSCPRRFSFDPAPSDLWEKRNYSDGITHCSYCGCMNNDTFMELLENEKITIGTTDKNYKVYVHMRDDTSEVLRANFYFQHLTEEQKRRFVDLYNDNKVHFDQGGDFYVTPYFMKFK